MTKFICERCTEPCRMEVEYPGSVSIHGWIDQLDRLCATANWRELAPGNEPRPAWKQNSLYIPPGSSDTVRIRSDGSVLIRDFRCPGCKEKGEEIERLEEYAKHERDVSKALDEECREKSEEINRLKKEVETQGWLTT